MCFDTQEFSTDDDIFDYLKNQFSHGNTRAGFESATVFSPLKELSSLNKSIAPLSSVGADHTKHSSLLLT
jgi:hypothetical protein